MKRQLAILFSLFLALEAPASIMMKSRDMAIFEQVERLQVPYSQLTKLKDKQFLIETGNSNVLKNPNFQAGTVGEGWTVNLANLDYAISDQTVMFNGAQSLQLDLKQGNFTDLELISQSYTADSYKLTGTNLEFAIRIAKSALNSGVNLKWCYYADGVQKNCVLIPSAPADTAFQEFWNIIASENDGNTVYKVALLATYNVVSGPVGYLNLADAYLGPARKLSIGAPPNTFTAEVSSAGVVSKQSPENWISSGTFSTPYYVLTPVAGKFSSELECSITLAEGQGSWFDAFMQDRGPNSISYGWRIGSGASVGNPAQAKHTIRCTKTGPDNVQPAITQNMSVESWSGYMQGGGWSRTNTAFGDFPAGFSISVTTYSSQNMSVSAVAGGLPGITWTSRGASDYYVCANLPSTNNSARATNYIAISTLSGINFAQSTLTATIANDIFQHSLCGILRVTSAGTTGIKVTGAAGAGTITLGTNGVDGAIRFSIVKISQSFPFPQLLGGITAGDDNNQYVMESVRLGACTSSPCPILSRVGNRIASVSRSSTGDFSPQFAGVSSAPEWCGCDSVGAQDHSCRVYNLTSTTSTMRTYTVSGSLQDPVQLFLRCFFKK